MGRFDETVCHCALNRIFGYEPRVALALIDTLGSASAVFELGRSGLDDLLGPFARHRDDICFTALEQAAEELNRLSAKGCRFLPISDESYPSLLRDCEDPPVGLYYKGVSEPQEIFCNANTIAVVGTRDISQYGIEWCERIVKGLSDSGSKPTIVSGLALGTDIVAHRAAMNAGVPTIAVMATGIDEVYPYRHGIDAERISNTAGSALVTDYPPDTAPLQVNFLRRNRIIAGMSRATILIESKIRGGGMMTANLAFSYGREVYALPGRIDDARSQGCNHLIRARVAESISSEVELGKSLGLEIKRSRRRDILLEAERLYADSTSPDMMERIRAVIVHIGKNRGADAEDLAHGCGLTYQAALETLTRLEADGLIAMDMLQRCSLNLK